MIPVLSQPGTARRATGVPSIPTAKHLAEAAVYAVNSLPGGRDRTIPSGRKIGVAPDFGTARS